MIKIDRTNASNCTATGAPRRGGRHAIRKRPARPAAAALALAAALLLPMEASLANEQLRGLIGACETKFVFTGELTATVTGTCRYGHLGLTTCVAEQTVTPGGDGSLRIENDGVCVAANGDELFTHFSGLGVPTSAGGVDFVGTETYEGGTGRFVNAFGGSTLSGSAQFTGPGVGVGAFSLRGRIAY